MPANIKASRPAPSFIVTHIQGPWKLWGLIFSADKSDWEALGCDPSLSEEALRRLQRCIFPRTDDDPPVKLTLKGYKITPSKGNYALRDLGIKGFEYTIKTPVEPEEWILNGRVYIFVPEKDS